MSPGDGPLTKLPEDSELATLPDGRRLHGVVDAGFGAVADLFIANFTERRDVGAGCTVFVGGRRVVDLWGGIADARVGRAWKADTAAVIFSCSKGVLALCVYQLVQDGRLDLDDPIARYWPAFGSHGKEAITIRQAMSHRAGLPSLDLDLTMDDVIHWDPVIQAIETQHPKFTPEDGFLYHAMTYGWILGEVVRLVTGQTPGRYFRTAIANRLGLRTWIGIPNAERGSVAWMEPPLPDEGSDAAIEDARVALDNPIVQRSLTMSGAFAFPAEGAFVTFNDPAIQAAEIPAANGISTPRSLAYLYAACVSSVSNASPLLTPASIKDATRVQSSGQQLSGAPDDGARWGTGFQLASPPTQPMIGPSSFGHAGAGGQLGFADAEHQVGFAYLSNQMGGYGDRRARELSDAVRTILGA